MKTLSIGTGIAALVTILPLQAAPAQVGTFDVDGDGSITRTEFVRGRAARFAALDRNGDQTISAEDFPAGKQAMVLDRKVDQVIADADLNRDGKITQLELELTGTPLFERADRDGNGIVERDEIAQFKAQVDTPDGDSGTPREGGGGTEPLDAIAQFKAALGSPDLDSGALREGDGIQPTDEIAQFKAELASPDADSATPWEYEGESEPVEWAAPTSRNP